MEIYVNVDTEGNPTSIQMSKETKNEMAIYMSAYNDCLADFGIINKLESAIGKGVAKKYVGDYWKIKNYEKFYKMIRAEIIEDALG